MKTLLLRPFLDTVSILGVSPPTSIMHLASFLKSKDLKAGILDTCMEMRSFHRMSLDNPNVVKLFKNISEYNPDIIGMTLFSSELNEIAALSRLMKQQFRSTYVVLGGPHPTAMPQKTMEEISECDFVVQGEGESVLYNLIKNLSQNGPLNRVKGICFREKYTQKIICNEPADVVADINELPFPDRLGLMENYKNKKYYSLLHGIPSDVMITSRGCPFQCSFCFKISQGYRSRSPENVLSEIDYIIRTISPKNIQIMDDSFTIEKDRCVKILDYLIKAKYPCRFKIRSRANAIDEYLLKKMKKAGIETIVYGFESGSQKMLDLFNKGTTVEQNTKACRLTKEAGINCFADMLLFYPGENQKTILETQQFLKKVRPTGVRISILTPFPGTEVYEQAKAEGWLANDWVVDKGLPWIETEEFRNPEEMRKIATRIYIKNLLKARQARWLIKNIGRRIFDSPVSYTRIAGRICRNVFYP